MRYIKITDYIKNLTQEEIDWFDKNLIKGIKNQNRPDLERGLLLYSICKKIKAKRCLDIGTAGFFSARSMAKYGCEVDTIDIKGEKDPNDGWDNINFIKGDSTEVLDQLNKNSKTYDLVFIDGSHDYETVKRDIINAKIVSNLLVCHDYGNLPEVTRAIDEEILPDAVIIEDRMWYGAPYENGYDKNGNKIDYGLVIYDPLKLLGEVII